MRKQFSFYEALSNQIKAPSACSFHRHRSRINSFESKHSDFEWKMPALLNKNTSDSIQPVPNDEPDSVPSILPKSEQGRQKHSSARKSENKSNWNFKQKVYKIMSYWEDKINSTPNVFKLQKMEKRHSVELIDFSCKMVLANCWKKNDWIRQMSQQQLPHQFN